MEKSIIIYEYVSVDIVNRLLQCEEIKEDNILKLKQYKKKIKEGRVKVTYNYANKLKIGRLYAKGPSLQNFKKCIRHTLAGDIYYDIDFVNSGATILKQYCKKNKIECSHLEDYVKNREKILTAVMKIHNVSRDEAKNFMTKQITLGPYDLSKDGKKLKFIERFRDEMKEISEKIYKSETNKKIVTMINKDETKLNKKASVVSNVIFDIENRCLQSMKQFFEDNNFIIGPLCFDGIMIKKDDSKCIDDHILNECIKYIKSDTEYTVNIISKPMDDRIDITTIIDPYVVDDKSAQEKLFSLHGKNKFKYCGGSLYIFNDLKGIFEECGDDNVPLTKLLIFYQDVLLIDDGKETKKCKSYGTNSILIPRLIPFIKAEAEDTTWLNRTDESSLGFLLFKNGIYDMKTGKFNKNFNKKIVFHESINFDFPKRNEKYIDYARKLTFELYFDDYMPLLVALARSLAGDRGNKSFYFCPGEPNSGKSYLVQIFTKCFEGYIGTFNCEDLSYNRSDRDEAANNRWAYLHRYKRILFSNECNMKKSLNSNSIKKFSSGGDKIVGRVHHGLETGFIPHFHLFCMLNDIPNIEPIDEALGVRLQYCSFNKVFVNYPKDGQNKIDPHIDTKINSTKFRDGFIHLVLDAYLYFLENGQPKFDEKVKEEQMDNGNPNSCFGIRNLILENYEITDNDKDTVLSSEIRNFKDKNKIDTFSPTKFNSILVSLGAKQAKSGNIRLWRRIKRINNNDFDADFI